MTHRPMNWVEKTLADHADIQHGYDVHFQGCKEVEQSKRWYAWERFADAMQSLTLRVQNSPEQLAYQLDTRDRIREYGPSGRQQARRTDWEEPRQ